MATITWDAWDEDLLSDIRGIEKELLRHHVRLAAIDYLSQSWAWVVDQGPIAIVAGTATYDWVPPAQTGVQHILQAWIDKKRITPKTRNELSELYGDYMHVDGPAQFFIQDAPDALILVPNPTAPSTSTGLTAKIAIVPTLDAVGMDEGLGSHYFDEIGKGTKARLFTMAGKPWTDVPRGVALKEEFEQEAASAKMDMIRSYAGARLRVRAQFF